MATKELSDHQKMVEEMRDLGLHRDISGPTCKCCKYRCEWIAENNEYCFVCIRKGRIKFEYPKTHLVGRLCRSTDPSQPELFIRLTKSNMYRVAKQGHPMWDGAMLCERDFVYIKKAKPKRVA